MATQRARERGNERHHDEMGLDMLSRVAEAIYWMCRYVERAENVARFIEVNHHLVLDLPVEAADQWEPLVKVSGDMALFQQRHTEASENAVLDFLTFDAEYANSMLCCLRAARENGRSVRESISSEMWEQLNAFYLFLTTAASQGAVAEHPHAFYSEVKRHSHLFTGLMLDTMSHGEAWHFARMGRLLERADKTSRMLDVKYFLLLPRVDYVGTPYDNIQWAAVLKSASALEMYRKRFNRITPRQVADFLLCDREFPRAMRFCLIAAEKSMNAITGSPAGTFQNRAERQLGRLRAELDYADIEEILNDGMHEYLDAFQTKLNALGDAISETFFSLRAPQPSRAELS